MLVGLIVFAAIAIFIVRGAQRASLDDQLQATADAVRIVGDVEGDDLVVDAKDRRQFLTIVGARAQSAIVARDGTILVSTDDRVARTLVTRIGVFGENGFSDVRIADATLRLFDTPIRSGATRIGETLAWRDLDVVDDVDERVAEAFAVVIPIVVLLALLAGTAIARSGLEPLERIARLASEIEAQDLSRRIALPARSDELGRLAATFDRMLDRLQSAFDRERRFTSDASHELRAPLSVIRAEADLALRHEREPSEYRRALETIAAESDALEALTRDLLAAARHGTGTEDVREPVDLAEIATAVASRLGAIGGSRRVTVMAADGPAIFESNRTLLERAVLGVVHNALKFSPEAGAVEIRVTAASGSAEIVVTDNGPGFSQAALEHGFDRFWRDDDARSTEGSGLGLSLAKTIVERYGGTIVLSNALPAGGKVTMSFTRVRGR